MTSTPYGDRGRLQLCDRKDIYSTITTESCSQHQALYVGNSVTAHKLTTDIDSLDIDSLDIDSLDLVQ